MRSKAAQAFIAIAQLIDSNIKIYSYDETDLKVEFAQKVNFYRNHVTKLKELVSLKKERIGILNQSIEKQRYSESFVNDHKIEIVELEIEILDLEMSIAAKNYYESVFAAQYKYHNDAQKQTSREAVENIDKLMFNAENLLKQNVLSDKNVLMLKALMSNAKNYKTDNERNDTYSRLKDFLGKNNV